MRFRGFRGAVKAYLRGAEMRLARSTFRSRRSALRLLEAELGAKPLRCVTLDDLDAYARRRLEAGISPVTVNGELRAYSALRTWALERGRAVGARPKYLPERPAFDVRFWSRAEVARLFEAARDLAPAVYPIVVLLANTGLRRGESIALRWVDVDFARRLIHVRPSEDWTPKSRRPRVVPMNDIVLRLLRDLPRASPWVFPSTVGERWAYWPQAHFDRARDAAGLTGGVHTLRHTFATEFLARCPHLPMLAQILGHTDEKVTRIYAHLMPEHLAGARNAVRFPAAPHRRRMKKSQRLGLDERGRTEQA